MRDQRSSRTINCDEPLIHESACILDSNRSRPNFLSTLFRALDDAQIRYCVLHSWKGLPQELPSDLDIAVHPEDHGKLPWVFGPYSEKGYRSVQLFNYCVNAYYFIFFWVEGSISSCVAVDIIFEHRGWPDHGFRRRWCLGDESRTSFWMRPGYGVCLPPVEEDL